MVMIEDAISDRNIPAIDAAEVKDSVLKELNNASATVIVSMDIE